MHETFFLVFFDTFKYIQNAFQIKGADAPGSLAVTSAGLVLNETPQDLPTHAQKHSVSIAFPH
jgi:hypothetical protein